MLIDKHIKVLKSVIKDKKALGQYVGLESSIKISTISTNVPTTGNFVELIALGYGYLRG